MEFFVRGKQIQMGERFECNRGIWEFTEWRKKLEFLQYFWVFSNANCDMKIPNLVLRTRWFQWMTALNTNNNKIGIQPWNGVIQAWLQKAVLQINGCIITAVSEIPDSVHRKPSCETILLYIRYRVSTVVTKRLIFILHDANTSAKWPFDTSARTWGPFWLFFHRNSQIKITSSVG